MLFKKKKIIPVLLLMLLLSACGQQEQVGSGSTFFRDFAIADKDGEEGIVYTSYKEHFDLMTGELPDSVNFCAVYDGKLYYADTFVGMETGEIKEGHVKILSCEADGSQEETILEIGDAAYLGDAMIQSGLLYCSWLPKEGTLQHIVMDLGNGKKTEFTSEHAVKAVTADGFYYLVSSAGNDRLYFSDYRNLKKTLVFDADTSIRAVYRAGEDVAILTYNTMDNQSILITVRKDGSFQSYTGLNRIVKNITGSSPEIVSAEGDILYYTLSVGEDFDEGRNNTVLLRWNRADDTKEICGKWYSP